jgi:arylsulfatase A-like enzyme
MPTLCEIGKGEVPENCDGISFLPTLLGEDGQKQHKYLYWERKDNWQVAREGNWKLHKKEGVFELYNLDTDISEKKNMAGKHSEIVDRLNRYIEEAHVTRVNGEIYDAELSQKARQTVKKRNAHKKTFPPGHFVEGVL